VENICCALQAHRGMPLTLVSLLLGVLRTSLTLTLTHMPRPELICGTWGPSQPLLSSNTLPISPNPPFLPFLSESTTVFLPSTLHPPLTHLYLTEHGDLPTF
jgi:hypothetical protein